MYLLGFDIGSSSIKAALVRSDNGAIVGSTKYPENEMPIQAAQGDWAEQDPNMWWDYCLKALAQLTQETGVSASSIDAIGISYQMHGLVLVDKAGEVLRPSIIWCDSRAVSIGQNAFDQMGGDMCLSKYLNSPGNFTASKLKWVKENEPEVYAKVHKAMLPGDYIAYKLSGDISTSIGGLSEGIFWDFKDKGLASDLLKHYGIDEDLLPEHHACIANTSSVSTQISQITGLKAGTPISYRAGDQPNNAVSLNVMKPGEVAATGGTSGVVYALSDQPLYDPKSRVNAFAHVDYSSEKVNIGTLLCINGTGILFNYVRKMFFQNMDYGAIGLDASAIKIGANGLSVLPFGNGAERMLENKDIGSHFMGINFNIHERAHIARASLEGIAFAFHYGMEVMTNMGLPLSKLKVGNDNLFQSDIFSDTLSTLSKAEIEVYESTGAAGAARAAGVGAGFFSSIAESNNSLEKVNVVEPHNDADAYIEAYELWKSRLEKLL